MRSAFQVESLEPRILLSADPAGAAAQMLALRDVDELRLSQAAADALRLQSLSQATAGQAPQQQVALLGAAPSAAGAAPADFAVDAGIAAGAFLDSTAALSAQARAGDLQLGVAGPAFHLDAGRFDAASLVIDGTAAGALWVDAGATLAGSGTLGGPVRADGNLAPGYSPGHQQFNSGLTLGAGAVTQIELGGTTPETGHDLLTVTGLAALSGKLEVVLFGGFVPQVGDSFEFLRFDSVSGGFNAASGLVDLGHGLAYTLQQTSTSLRLVVQQLDTATASMAQSLTGTAALNGHALVDDDVIGMALNLGYFAPQLAPGASLAVTGSLAIEGALSLSGTVALGYLQGLTLGGQTVDGWQVGIANGSGRLGPGSGPALTMADADAALLWLDSRSSTDGWLWAQGNLSGLALQGSSGIGLSASASRAGYARIRRPAVLPLRRSIPSRPSPRHPSMDA
jgi:hypothetical protein